MLEHKILFTGTVGAGKTTAIQAVSEIPVVLTDVQTSDPSIGKESTTVALDYGEISLGQSERLRLYGTPGQERFAFMWKVLAQGALGLVILIDNSRPNPAQDLALYLDHFQTLIRNTACVVAITKTDAGTNAASLRTFSDLMQKKQLIYPIIVADVRERQQVLRILDLLLVQMEVRQ